MTTAATTSTRTAVTMRRRVLGFTSVMVRGRYRGGMHRLRLFAITIDDVRDIFGADPALASQLRAVAAEHFAPPRPERAALSRIGPLFSRHRHTEVDTRNPLSADVDSMLSGGHIPEDRRPQCWKLLLVWLETLATQRLDIRLDAFETPEFELARAGLPSSISLRSLAARELGTPLRPEPTQIVGYSKHGHVAEFSHQLRRIHDEALEEFSSTMRSIEPVLALAEDIAQRPERELDLVVIEIPD